jgi:hypothetical protein
LAGQIDMTFIGVDTVVRELRAGRIKAYAVLAKSRFATAPDIPTVDEAGLPCFYFSLWYALFAPKRTPRIIVEAHYRRPKSRGGGRSSRRPASRRSKSNQRLITRSGAALCGIVLGDA